MGWTQIALHINILYTYKEINVQSAGANLITHGRNYGIAGVLQHLLVLIVFHMSGWYLLFSLIKSKEIC